MDAEKYEKNGVFYDRPTHILDYFNPPELVDWKIRTPPAEVRRISRIALKHGSRIDELIRQGKEPKKSDDLEIKNCYKAWMKWKSDFMVKDEDIEFPETFYDEENRLAGTPDIYWRPRRMMIDVKSSKSVHEGYLFQVGGFYSRHPKYPTDEVAILRSDKEIAEYQFVTNTSLKLSLEELRASFDGLVKYYRGYKRVQSTLNPKEKVYDGSYSE